MEGSSPLEMNPLAAIHPSMEGKNNIMTLEELDTLKETYSFPSRVRVRLPEEGETITSAHPGEVAFYEAAFPAGLRFPTHPTIRNLFSLNSNPKLDQGWLYFKARNKKTLLGGYPSNVKGWKSKFFFVTGDEWELPEGSSREGAPRVLRTWGFQHCNNPPRLYGDEPKVLEEIFKSIEKTGRFSVPVLLKSKSFRQVFVSFGSMASGTAGESHPSGKALSSSGDMDESQNSHEHAQGRSPSRDYSIECLGSIRTKMRRILPHIPDLTLLRWSGGKVFDPIFNRNPSSDSNPTSEFYSIRANPSSLTQMRINFKKLSEKLEKSKNESFGIPAPAKGVVIGEKRTRESLASSASKKGKVNDGSKGKGVDREPEGKKKATSFEQCFDHPSQGLVESRGRVGRLGEQTSLQEGRAASMETKVARLQKLSSDLEQQLAKARVREQQANDELTKAKSDRDSLVDKFERSGALVVELREALDKAKEFAVEEFKSSSEFVVAIEDFASKYFGEGFDFCKVQLRRHHPDEQGG
ncbi:hypothetical protein Acr_18g0011680 [Actinidia rufa]|uniref:Uncharacterized protein n=1 Tax=Actinidia rufa TaxID=165716 RepID=A0A7J0G8G8_9ERIC|nr:hypothetical protein Acr_18g0011680 [Actinidia rufa]